MEIVPFNFQCQIEYVIHVGQVFCKFSPMEKEGKKKTKKQINPYSHECVIDYNQDLTIT